MFSYVNIITIRKDSMKGGLIGSSTDKNLITKEIFA